MYHHVKKLMFTVRVDEPDPRLRSSDFRQLLEEYAADLRAIIDREAPP